MSVFERLRILGFGNTRSIPCLDGLRAVAVLMVVVAHLGGTAHFFVSKDSVLVGLGTFGVRIFFVISGYLITHLLMAEEMKSGTISLRHFYFRRSMRLFPAAFVFVTFMAVMSYYGLVQLHKYDLLAAYTYTMNYHLSGAPTIGHLWSLAIEEQFYLIWPFLFLGLIPRRRVVFLKWLIILVPFIRMTYPYTGSAISFLASSDALATGCLLALLQQDLEENPRYLAWFTPKWVLAASAIALLCNYTPSTKVRWLVSETIMNLCIALVVHWLIVHPKSRAGLILNWSPLMFLGVLSYSLYLWQQPFSHFGMQNHLTDFPVNILLIAGLAMLSYLLVETPCLRLRKNLERFYHRENVPPRPSPVVVRD